MSGTERAYSPKDPLHDQRVQALLTESAGTINGVPFGDDPRVGFRRGHDHQFCEGCTDECEFGPCCVLTPLPKVTTTPMKSE